MENLEGDTEDTLLQACEFMLEVRTPAQILALGGDELLALR